MPHSLIEFVHPAAVILDVNDFVKRKRERAPPTRGGSNPIEPPVRKK